MIIMDPLPIFRKRPIRHLLSNDKGISTTEYILIIAAVTMTAFKFFGASFNHDHYRELASRDGGNCFATIDKLLITGRGKEVTSKVPLYKNEKVMVKGVTSLDGVLWGVSGVEGFNPLPKVKMSPDGRYEVQLKDVGKNVRFICKDCNLTNGKPVEIEILASTRCGFYVDNTDETP
jgi:hypothetical protein